MTSPSGDGPLAMTPTILGCSRATSFHPRDQTLPSTATLPWMPSTPRNLRQHLFQQLHQIYRAQLPFITLYSATLLFIVRKGTHNYLPGPFLEDNVNMWEWWCDGGKC